MEAVFGPELAHPQGWDRRLYFRLRDIRNRDWPLDVISEEKGLLAMAFARNDGLLETIELVPAAASSVGHEGNTSSMVNPTSSASSPHVRRTYGSINADLELLVPPQHHHSKDGTKAVRHLDFSEFPLQMKYSMPRAKFTIDLVAVSHDPIRMDVVFGERVVASVSTVWDSGEWAEVSIQHGLDPGLVLLMTFGALCFVPAIAEGRHVPQGRAVDVPEGWAADGVEASRFGFGAKAITTSATRAPLRPQPSPSRGSEDSDSDGREKTLLPETKRVCISHSSSNPRLAVSPHENSTPPPKQSPAVVTPSSASQSPMRQIPMDDPFLGSEMNWYS